MRNILLTGGMGSGKSELAKALVSENPNINYIYTSKYAVRIPLSLIATTNPELVSLSKSDYIETIFKNIEIPSVNYSREDMDDFGQIITDTIGATIIAELALRACMPGLQNLVDNMPKVSNVKYLIDKGFYVVNFHCKPETQLERRLKNKKDIDPSEISSLEKQIQKTNSYFEIGLLQKLSHVSYDTDKLHTDDYPVIASQILHIAGRP